MAAITFERVTKRYVDTVAVDALDLEVADGEFLALVGPSGCGKSTVLRLIAGLETPDEGIICIDDQIVNDIEAKTRDVAMVFQSYALYPHMSVRKNIAFALKPLALDRAERDQRVQSAAIALGLGPVLERKPGQLSGGERQRVALARAIVRQPRAFLMDEPLSNLDAALRVETRTELVRLHRQLEATFVYVTHDQQEAMAMADRIAVMIEGRLHQVARPDELYDRPVNLAVARFMGSPVINTWDATISATGDEVTVDGTVLPLPPGQRSPQVGSPVIVAARPESVRLAVAGLPVVVENVEPTGHEQLVTCRRTDGSAVVLRVDRGDAPRTGEHVHVTIDPAQLLLFDAESQARL